MVSVNSSCVTKRSRKNSSGKLKGEQKVGVLSVITAWMLRAKPFQSDSLDRLAESMNATRILKRRKLQRYYRAPMLANCCVSYSDAVFFDSTYFDNLSSEELLAVGAHEFNHINKKHDMQKIKRQILPALLVGALLGFLAYINFNVLNSFISLNQVGQLSFGLLIMLVSFIILLSASFYFNAEWLRHLETQSDLSAVNYVNGEALISALTKLSELRPKKSKHKESRFFPKTYPTVEQRIANIRGAMERTD